jgi:sulfur relay (sulfurtransferase) DsrF/TusC family protein
MKVLQVVGSAYRCNLEEQDDPVLWITAAMKGAGAELDVLLAGNSVVYATRGQDASGLAFGAKKQTQPPRIEDDLLKLITKGARIFAVAEDADERGLAGGSLLPRVKAVPRSDLPRLFEEYDRVWTW